MDVKRSKLTDLVEVGIVFNQDTFHIEKKEERGIIRLERRIHELEEKATSEKSNKTLKNEFKDYILATHESHSNTQEHFMRKC